MIVVAVLAAVMVIALALVLVLPRIRQISDYQTKIDAAKQEDQAAKTLLEQRTQVKKQAAATSAKILQLAVAVPEGPELPTLIIELQDTAYSSGVELRSVRPDENLQVTEGLNFVGIPVEMSLIGTWADTVDFLQQLGRLSRTVRVTNVAVEILEPDEELAGQTGVKFPPYYQVKSTVKVTAYAIPAASAPATPAPAPAPAP